jgi:SAM-dependent methyltransferase
LRLLSVAVCADVDGPFDGSWLESLTRFTPELEEWFAVSHDTPLASVLRQGCAPFVAFLDGRTAVSPGWAARLIRALEGSGAGAIGPLSNGAACPQHRPADYQDIPGFLAFAEQVAKEHAGQFQVVDALDPFCILSRRDLLAALDPHTHTRDLAEAVRAAGRPLAVVLDTYLHSFADYHDHARPELQALIPPDARRILDVGCGAGILGAALKRRVGVEVVGVEADSAVAERARQVLDRVHLGDIESLGLPYGPGAFDCIVLADILEHLRDPWNLLRRLVPLLRAPGRLIASLPNVRHWSVLRGLLEGEWSYLPAGVLDRGHLRFFTRTSGRALLEAAGLRVVEIRPVSSGSVPDLSPLIEVSRALSLDPSTLAEEARVTQYLFVAERRG